MDSQAHSRAPPRYLHHGYYPRRPRRSPLTTVAARNNTTSRVTMGSVASYHPAGVTRPREAVIPLPGVTEAAPALSEAQKSAGAALRD